MFWRLKRDDLVSLCNQTINCDICYILVHTHSQFLMPGLVDCHFHPAQYSIAGIVPGTFPDLSTLISAELAFRNTTFAREQSMALVVSRFYTVTVIFQFCTFRYYLTLKS